MPSASAKIRSLIFPSSHPFPSLFPSPAPSPFLFRFLSVSPLASASGWASVLVWVWVSELASASAWGSVSRSVLGSVLGSVQPTGAAWESRSADWIAPRPVVASGAVMVAASPQEVRESALAEEAKTVAPASVPAFALPARFAAQGAFSLLPFEESPLLAVWLPAPNWCPNRHRTIPGSSKPRSLYCPSIGTEPARTILRAGPNGGLRLRRRSF